MTSVIFQAEDIFVLPSQVEIRGHRFKLAHVPISSECRCLFFSLRSVSRLEKLE